MCLVLHLSGSTACDVSHSKDSKSFSCDEDGKFKGVFLGREGVEFSFKEMGVIMMWENEKDELE